MTMTRTMKTLGDRGNGIRSFCLASLLMPMKLEASLVNSPLETPVG